MTQMPEQSSISWGDSARRSVRRCALATIAMLYLWSAPTAAVLESCAQICDSDSDPAQECLYIPEDPEMEASESTCGDFGVCYQPGYCGDGFCGEIDGETPDNCEQDCFLGPGPSPSQTSTCGNSECERPAESNVSCPADCPVKTPVQCNDGICESTENVNNCPSDCEYTTFCWDNTECPDYGVCRARRCVYDPFPNVCLSSTAASNCASNEKCVQIGSSGYGICTPVF